jgi:3-hydroxyacyl-[acyl-carrier-protein] dehydratase
MIADIQAVLARLPHRYPFLLVDRILERGERDGQPYVKALKNVSVNEPYFQGHFPGRPIMPGVLQIEALAQASIFLLEDQMPEGSLAFLAGVEGVRFKKPVVPGDQLILESQLEFFRRSLGKVKTQALVDGVVVTEATIMFAVGK